MLCSHQQTPGRSLRIDGGKQSPVSWRSPSSGQPPRGIHKGRNILRTRFIFTTLLACLFVSPPLARGEDQSFFADVARARRNPADGSAVLSQMKARAPRTGDFSIPAPGSPGDPTKAGGTYRMCQGEASTPCTAIQLPRENWRPIGYGWQHKGWRYKGSGDGDDPCQSVILSKKKIKVRCKGPLSLSDNFVMPLGGRTVAIELTMGPTRFCTGFAAPYRRAGVRNSHWLAKGGRPPAECPDLDGLPPIENYGAPQEVFTQSLRGLIP